MLWSARGGFLVCAFCSPVRLRQHLLGVGVAVLWVPVPPPGLEPGCILAAGCVRFSEAGVTAAVSVPGASLDEKPANELARDKCLEVERSALTSLTVTMWGLWAGRRYVALCVGSAHRPWCRAGDSHPQSCSYAAWCFTSLSFPPRGRYFSHARVPACRPAGVLAPITAAQWGLI